MITFIVLNFLVTWLFYCPLIIINNIVASPMGEERNVEEAANLESLLRRNETYLSHSFFGWMMIHILL